MGNGIMAAVDIVLPTYNCAAWLDDFMESLLAQDEADWRIVVRDDASTDATVDRLTGWCDRLGGRMVILDQDCSRNLGVIGNNNAVLAATTARWVMLADPDDIWLPGKMSRSLAAIRAVETESGVATPVAVCTDAEVVDNDLRQLADSYWRWCRIDPDIRRVPRLALESPALSSTMTVNRALLDVALPLPAGAAYQDWWPAMVAAAFGKLICLPEKTIRYRRHAGTVTSDPVAPDLVAGAARLMRSPGTARRRLLQLLEKITPQAAAFNERYGERLSPSDRAALETVTRLRVMGPVQRRLAILRHRLRFASLLKTAGMLVLIG